MTDAGATGELRRVLALCELGRAAEARPRLAAFLASDPENADALRLMSWCHSELGDHTLAVRAARAAVAADPACAQAQRCLAAALYGKGDFRAAIPAARAAIRLDPEQWQSYWYLVHCLERFDPFAALDPAARARRLAPDLADVHVLYGDAVAAVGRYAEARESYLKALSIDANNATAHFRLAVVDQVQLRWFRSFARLRTSLRQAPQQEIVRRNLTEMILILLALLCVAAFACALTVTGISTVVGAGALRVIGMAIVGVLLVGTGALLGYVKLRVGRFVGTVLRRDRRALYALAVFGVFIAYLTAGTIAQVVPLARIGHDLRYLRYVAAPLGVLLFLFIVVVTAVVMNMRNGNGSAASSASISTRSRSKSRL